MNRVSDSLLLVAAGLALAAPTLAETKGLRGSVDADMAAEDDRAARRALQAQSFSPTFPPLPDIVPGIPIQLPPGAQVTSRTSNVMTIKSSTSSRNSEITAATATRDPDTGERFVGFNNVKSSTRNEGTEVTDFDIELTAFGPDDFELKRVKREKRTARKKKGIDDTSSVFFADATGAEGYYYNQKTSELSGNTEDVIDLYEGNQDGATDLYYYQLLIANPNVTASETIDHEYEIELSPPIP